MASPKSRAASANANLDVRSTPWLARERIGQGLQERYAVPKELPPRLLTLVEKLDAAEGNQLLRACRKRLRGLVAADEVIE